jgi:hypothetical protein
MQQTFEQYLARAIITGTRKKFSTLMGDFLQEQMNMASDELMQPQTEPARQDGPSTLPAATPHAVPPVVARPVDSLDLEDGTDTRAQASHVVMPAQPGPRDRQ